MNASILGDGYRFIGIAVGTIKTNLANAKRTNINSFWIFDPVLISTGLPTEQVIGGESFGIATLYFMGFGITTY